MAGVLSRIQTSLSDRGVAQEGIDILLPSRAFEPARTKGNGLDIWDTADGLPSDARCHGRQIQVQRYYLPPSGADNFHTAHRRL